MEAKRGVESRRSACLQNSAESGEQSVLTLSATLLRDNLEADLIQFLIYNFFILTKRVSLYNSDKLKSRV